MWVTVFMMALSASPPPDTDPVDQQQVMQDVDALYKAGQGRIGTDEVCLGPRVGILSHWLVLVLL